MHTRMQIHAELGSLVEGTLADAVIKNTPAPPTAIETSTILEKAL